jgi:hypothetical protein
MIRLPKGTRLFVIQVLSACAPWAIQPPSGKCGLAALLDRVSRSPLVLAYREFFNPITPDRVTNSRILGYANRTIRSQFDRGCDDVCIPVASACRNIARQSETGKGRHRDVMGAADTRFEHTAAPNGHAPIMARLLQFSSFAVTADLPHFDVNDAASLQFNGRLSMPGVVNTLVETDRRFKRGLKFRV